MGNSRTLLPSSCLQGFPACLFPRAQGYLVPISYSSFNKREKNSKPKKKKKKERVVVGPILHDARISATQQVVASWRKAADVA
jgi:hypothetical protein